MTGILTLGALGLGLSVDAFAAAVGKGAAIGKPRLRDAARIGLVFGTFEAIMPCIGWLIGRAVAGWITSVDHWVAFVLLAGVGGHMVWAAWHGDLGDDDAPAEERKRSGGMLGVVLTAIATSIDALAVGVSLAVIGVPILAACLVIGGVTAVVATAGVLVGRHAGAWLGRYAEVLGGVVLVLIGTGILVQHLFFGG
jgi:putative Mn2+ efflux pump MntP